MATKKNTARKSSPVASPRKAKTLSAADARKARLDAQAKKREAEAKKVADAKARHNAASRRSYARRKAAADAAKHLSEHGFEGFEAPVEVAPVATAKVSKAQQVAIDRAFMNGRDSVTKGPRIGPMTPAMAEAVGQPTFIDALEVLLHAAKASGDTSRVHTITVALETARSLARRA